MRKSFQFRIYPNKKQEVALERTLTTCRHLYNDSIAERKRNAELNRLQKSFDVFPWGYPEWINYYDQANQLSLTKTAFQKEVYSQVVQNTLKRVERSFQNFFKGAGYPRFQGRNRYNSFTYPGSGLKLNLNEGKLTLSKIGNIKIVLHREIEGKIKTCTIKRDVDQWYVSFSCEIDTSTISTEIKTITGIDVGLISLMTFSNGEKIEPPKYLRASEKRLAREQIHLSKKKKGSENRNKQRIVVAKVHRRIRFQRRDFNNKLSTNLVEKYDHVVFEKLQIQNMLKNHCLAKSIVDASWSQLIDLTIYKAEYAGKIVELVNPNGTSQTCVCGYPVPKDLSVRVHRCPSCGLVLDRDHVSAMIIESRSSTAGIAGIEARQSNPNREAMKREATLLVGW
ncbi:MAG TPA: RNA-guided endonuclease TnpB family protein [Candidatus Methanoperedens sp.]|nr:RNA-guided endonuclease TnpB family protein [Candidatus Methanoperedens sp.]